MMKQRMDNNLKCLQNKIKQRMDNNVKDLKNVMDKTLSVSQFKILKFNEIGERFKVETLITYIHVANVNFYNT